MAAVILMYVLIIPGIAVFFKLKRDGNQKASLTVKGLCTFIILACAIGGGVRSGEPYTVWIPIGLFFALIGDITIGLSFLAGMVFFMMNHISYIMAFIGYGTRPAVSAALFVIVFAAQIIVYLKVKPKLGGLLVPVIVYSLIIITMLSLSASTHLVLFVGAALFAVSDALLATLHFGKYKRAVDVVSLSCYYLGQSLFAVFLHLN